MSKAKFNEAQKQKICKEYLEGKSTYELGMVYNCHNSTISEVLIKNNIPRRDGNFKSPYVFDEHWFDNLDSSDKYYVLGLIYADGCNLVDRNKIVITLKQSDVGLLEKINKLLKSNRPIVFSKTPQNYENSAVLSFTSAYFCKKVENLGVIPRKSNYVRFPNFIPEEFLSHFIRGYYDGDGGISIYKNKNNTYRAKISITSNPMFCEDIREIIENRLEFKVFITHYSEHCAQCRFGSVESASKFLNWIYKDADLFLERKYKLYQTFINSRK